eukprot:6182767-Pleurochrysis_carterae.AAC.3
MASLVFADPMMAGSSSGMAYGEGGTSQADWLKGTMGTSTDSDISSSTCRVGLERIFVMKPGAHKEAQLRCELYSVNGGFPRMITSSDCLLTCLDTYLCTSYVSTMPILVRVDGP